MHSTKKTVACLHNSVPVKHLLDLRQIALLLSLSLSATFKETKRLHSASKQSPDLTWIK